jgi:superfamily II DNA or RNA helicase
MIGIPVGAGTKLSQVIFCPFRARRFSGEPLIERLALPDLLPAALNTLSSEDLQPSFASPYLRPADVPLAFHRESPHSNSILRFHSDALEKMSLYGQMLQYVFSDGMVINANELLYHNYLKLVPRRFLPLSVNIKTSLQGNSPYIIMGGSSANRNERNSLAAHRASWQTQAEQVLISALLAIAQASTRAALEEDEDPVELYYTHTASSQEPRPALKLQGIELAPPNWGAWRLTTDLPPPHSGIHYGRARIEIDPNAVGELAGLSEGFYIDTEGHRLVFHTFREQVRRIQSRVEAPAAEVEKPHELDIKESQLGLEAGLALHLSGHASIQATTSEINELLGEESREIAVYPRSIIIKREDIHPRLLTTGDGSLRFVTMFPEPNSSPAAQFEAHGFPRALNYILTCLQSGLSATTGLNATQIAHARKGIKRERDIKTLRHLGLAQLIFFDAANFAFNLPLSDGTTAHTEDDLYRSLFDRIGSMTLKSEGWPVTTGSLETLCSTNVISIIKGFIKQVINDARGREVHLYLPQGELRLEGFTQHPVAFFHALVADLATATEGSCFTRARTKYFDNFLEGHISPELSDLAVRLEDTTHAVYQPGVNERYTLPESSIAPHGTNLLGLVTRGFELSIDGRFVEEFEASEFRPEFNLEEESSDVPIGARKIDWFELHPKFFFKGVEIPAEQAARLSKDGMIEFQGRLYRVRPKDMPSLKRLTQFWAEIQTHNAGLNRTKRRRTEETYFSLPRSQTLALLALRATGVKMSGGPRWKEICAFYDSLDQARPPLELPDSFKTKLQPYQEKAVTWMSDIHKLGLGAILADDMGLGKTVTSLAFLEGLRAKGRLGPTLILVPTSLTYNWLSESERFAPELPVLIFSSRAIEAMQEMVNTKPGATIICTYGLLQENAELFQQIHWHVIIFDEAQNLKNITTKRTTVARKLDAAFKLCLTGTPLENHYGEFYSLFDLIVPGSLGDLPAFRERYVNPPRVLREDLEFLRLKTHPLMLRRTKSQVMHELPPKVETTIKLPFEENQKRIYRDIASSYNEQVRSAIATNGEAKSQLQMLTALLRLRQACSDPSAIPGVQYDGEPPKVATLIEAIEEIVTGGASALVFTQFLATFERIRSSLTKAKVPFFDIHGADSRLAREKKLRAFEEASGGAVMLMTLKTGGVGLNLTKASYVFHIEPWWNPAVENQATDRAHRMGQNKTVQVYRYLIRDSVEEKIEILKEVKTKRFDALFTQSENIAEMDTSSGALSQRDFEYLLGE